MMMFRQSLSIPFAPADYGTPLAPREPAAVPAVAAAGPLATRMDEAAFQAFYRETAPMLRAYIRRASGDAALADDILQEAFYRFLRADLRSLEKNQMKAYLYRSAGTLLTDHWRKQQRDRRWSLKGLFGEKGEPSEPAIAQKREEESDAMLLFRRLKPQEQQLLWLAYVEGFEHREIAAAMDLSEKSIRVMLFRARKKLAASLTKGGFGPAGLSRGASAS